MFAVIFEVEPKPEGKAEYLDIAAALRQDLEKMDGFISIERFQSLTDDGKILSLSFWRDEAAIAAWREQSKHQRAQDKGYNELFDDYRLRVAEVVRDYTRNNREEAPQDVPARK
jgi:heme-degrading monooxygenase HmoA|tara:strand:+ start:8748 stop:9089 length:342 start_codon:yes stop_codon:yes gene_type:complete